MNPYIDNNNPTELLNYTLNYYGITLDKFKQMSDNQIKKLVKKFSDILNDGKITKSKKHKISNKGSIWGSGNEKEEIRGHNDSGSYSRYFSLDSWWNERIKKLPESVQKVFPFLIVSKASKSEKNKGLNNNYSIQLEVNQCEENIEQDILQKKVIYEFITKVISEWNMMLSGKKKMEKSQRGIVSIILTEINKTIPLKTWNCLTIPLTKEFIVVVIRIAKEFGLNLAVNVDDFNLLQNIMKENQELVHGVKNVALKMQLKISIKENKNIHPTCKPIKLMSYLITLGSREGDVILDPFMGSGTTGITAKLLNRKFIGIELSEEYIKIAKARIQAWNNKGDFNDEQKT